jgi:hypothetical protein
LNTPGDTLATLKRKDKDDEEIEKNILYHEAVSSLLYLMLGSWPNIANNMINLAQYTTNFNNIYWTAVKQIFRYGKGTINNILILVDLENDPNITLSGACNSNWTEDLDDRCSTEDTYLQ